MNELQHTDLTERDESHIVEMLVRMHSGEVTEVDHQEFTNWSQQHPELLSVYREYEVLWYETSVLSAELDHKAYRELLSNVEFNSGFSKSKRLYNNPVWAIAASVVLAVSLVISLVVNQSSNTIEYQTGRGERLVIMLQDDSSVQLNAMSRLEISFTDSSRNIALLEGEALFSVAKDPQRPFVVQTDRGQVQALGTEFNVNTLFNRMQVTVVEGTVLVAASEAELFTSDPLTATVGQQVTVSSAGLSKVEAIDAKRFLDWTDGKLIFNGEPLQEVAFEMNRHSINRLVVEDEALRNMPVYGSFDMGNSANFVSTLVAALPLIPYQTGENTTLLIPQH